MKIIFAATPTIALPVLEALNATEHEIVMVLTQPDRPSGRGRKLTHSPIKEYALMHKMSLYQPKTLKDPAVAKTLESLNPDLLIVIAYGLIIPKNILSLPKLGCINIHISLLPRWRGAAPAQRAILAGDKISGVSLMQMDQGLDTGPVLAYETYTMKKDETTASLHNHLGALGAASLIQHLNDIEHKKLPAIPQEEESMTYAAKVEKEEACLNWELSAIQIERMVRAFNPWPIAYTFLNKQRLRIWKVAVIKEVCDSPVGMIIGIGKEGIDVACGAGILRIEELQWSGRKPQSAQSALNANNTELKIGASFDSNE